MVLQENITMKNILEKSRYLAMIGVISLLIASFAAFAWGVLKAVSVIQVTIMSRGQDPVISVEFIGVIDSFLIATTMLIFAASLYELFIGPLELPGWMLAHSLYDLKTKLSSMIVLVMATKFLEKLLEVKDTKMLLDMSISITLVSAALIAFGYFGKKE
jgi:uncharacterized membrane protein YqhA